MNLTDQKTTATIAMHNYLCLINIANRFCL